MKCEQTQEFLTGFLLGDLDEVTRAEVETHLEQCAGCRAQRRELELTLDLVRDALSASSSEEAIPQRLSPDRRARITAAPPARRPLRMLSWLSVPHPGMAMTAAACLVLAFVVAGLLLPAVSSRKRAERESFPATGADCASVELAEAKRGYEASRQPAADPQGSTALARPDRAGRFVQDDSDATIVLRSRDQVKEVNLDYTGAPQAPKTSTRLLRSDSNIKAESGNKPAAFSDSSSRQQGEELKKDVTYYERKRTSELTRDHGRLGLGGGVADREAKGKKEAHAVPGEAVVPAAGPERPPAPVVVNGATVKNLDGIEQSADVLFARNNRNVETGDADDTLKQKDSIAYKYFGLRTETSAGGKQEGPGIMGAGGRADVAGGPMPPPPTQEGAKSVTVASEQDGDVGVEEVPPSTSRRARTPDRDGRDEVRQTAAEAKPAEVQELENLQRVTRPVRDAVVAERPARATETVKVTKSPISGPVGRLGVAPGYRRDQGVDSSKDVLERAEEISPSEAHRRLEALGERAGGGVVENPADPAAEKAREYESARLREILRGKGAKDRSEAAAVAQPVQAGAPMKSLDLEVKEAQKADEDSIVSRLEKEGRKSAPAAATPPAEPVDKRRGTERASGVPASSPSAKKSAVAGEDKVLAQAFWYSDMPDNPAKLAVKAGDATGQAKPEDEKRAGWEARALRASSLAAVQKTPEPRDLPAKFKAFGVNPFVEAASQAFSTFSIDVDTASYTVSRNYMLRGQRPPAEAVRTEEFVNFFDYAYDSPTRETFRVYAEAAPSKFGRDLHLLKIGIKGKRLGREEERAAVLTFLVDTSGSMDKPDRIGLMRKSLKMLLDKLNPRDQVAIVQFDSNIRLALDHTPASEKEKIAGVLDALQCSGSTHLEAGMSAAYELAARSFKPGAENRVLILSDGVANLGTMAAEDILARVEAYRKQGIYCSVFGFGIGTFDDTMLETLANKGNGTYSFIDSETEAKRVFVDDLAATLNTIASDVKIQVEFNPKRVVKYRQLGYENRQLKKEDFRNDAVDAGEVGSGQSVTALYEIELRDSREPLATVRLRYRRTDNGRVEEIERKVTAADLKQDFNKADTRFRLAACVAEFSEQLRGSPHAAGSDFADVASVLRPVALELPLDPRVQELLRLVQSASSLSLATP